MAAPTSGSVLWPFQVAMAERIAGDAALMAQLAAPGVYAWRVPQDPDGTLQASRFPCVTFGTVTEGEASRFMAAGRAGRFRLDVWSAKDDDQSEVLRIYAALDRLFTRQPLPLSAGVVLSLVMSLLMIIPDPGSGGVHGVLDVLYETRNG